MGNLDTGVGYGLLFGCLFFFSVIVIFCTKFKIKNILALDASYVLSKKKINYVYVGLSTFSTAMGSWILFAPPEVGALYGSWAVILYAVAVSIPMWAIMYFGCYLRRFVEADTFALSDVVRNRYGRWMEIIVQIISLFTMWVSLVGELLFVSYSVNLLATGVSRIAIIISVCLVTFIYASYGGLYGSIITDLFQGGFIGVLTILGIVFAIVHNNVTKEKWNEAATFSRNGAIAGWIMIFSYFPAYMMDQAVWQRVLAAKSEKDVRKGFLLGSFLVFPVMLLYGFSGVLSKANQDDMNNININSSSSFFFLLLNSSNKPINGLVIVLALCMGASTIDSIQNAIPSLISNFIQTKGYTFYWAQLFTLFLNILSIIAAIYWKDDVLILFLISNILCACAIPTILFGFFYKKKVNQICSVFSCISAFFSVFIVGYIFTHDFVLAISWITIPDGFGSYKTLITFIVASMTSLVMICFSTFFYDYCLQKFKKKESTKASPHNNGSQEIVALEFLNPESFTENKQNEKSEEKKVIDTLSVDNMYC